jgi:hypothetical protein
VYHEHFSKERMLDRWDAELRKAVKSRQQGARRKEACAANVGFLVELQ